MSRSKARPVLRQGGGAPVVSIAGSASRTPHELNTGPAVLFPRHACARQQKLGKSLSVWGGRRNCGLPSGNGRNKQVATRIMTMSDFVMVIAVLVAPFLAVYAQNQIEALRERRRTKLWIFKTLMATRAAILSPDHVRALNMIDLEFTGKGAKERLVVRRWREYLDHLGSMPQGDSDDAKAAMPVWGEKSNEHLTDLLIAMGNCFGYDLDKVAVRKGIYSPQGHAQDELEQRALRRLLLQVAAGRQPLVIAPAPSPRVEQTGIERSGDG